MSTQGDCMQHKVWALVNREAQSHSHTVPQPFDAPENKPVFPDNWYPAQTGTYFAERQEKPKTVPINQAVSTTRGDSRSPSRKFPTETQHQLDGVVETLTLQALEMHRQAEAQRMDNFKARRDVEILKMHQKTKRRVELQQASCQTIIGKSTSLMELEAPQQLGASQTSRHRDNTRNEPYRAFVENNYERIENNLMHREYCLESMKERETYRQTLEQQVGTFFAKKKDTLFGSVGVAGAASTFARFPTRDVLHQAHEKIIQNALEEAVQQSETGVAVLHMNQMDEKLWEEYRSAKGEKAKRTREVPYATTASFKRSP